MFQKTSTNNIPSSSSSSDNKNNNNNNNNKAKPSRKPSVLVSRQFNISDALNGYHKPLSTRTLNKDNLSSNHKETAEVLPSSSSDVSEPKKLMWKGRDGTPLPLVVPERSSTTVKNIRSDKNDGGEVDDEAEEEEEEEENEKDDDASKRSSTKLGTFEEIFAHFEKYRFDHDNSDDINDEILKVAAENVSVPWIAEVMKDLIVNNRASTSPDDQSFSFEQQNSDDECPPNLCDIHTNQPTATRAHGILEIVLNETQTKESFSLPSSTIIPDSKYYKQHVKDRNQEYTKSSSRGRKDSPKPFTTERAAQTFHSYQVHGSSQTDLKFKHVCIGCDDGPGHCDGDNVQSMKNFVEEVTSAAMMTDGCLFDVSDGYKPGDRCFCPPIVPKNASYSNIKKAKATQKFFESKSVRSKISMLERAVQQNNYMCQQVRYRGVRSVGELRQLPQDALLEDSLELLFRLECEMVAGMKTTGISWNKSNKDVLAVGYGGSQFASDEQGRILLWSIRNPAFPEKFYKVSSVVTTIDFASQKPQMLAVGLMDGRVLVYDTSSQHDSSVPLLDSAHTPGRHMSAVSKLIWVTDGHQDLSEKLISVSIDGRVLEWSLKKGLSSTLLMTLKRNDPKLCKGKLPNIGLGLSMDFLKDGKSYITGTDDGSLYHCSRSYVGRPTSVNRPHNASLTTLKYSPFVDNVFITAASDSKVKIHLICKKEDTIREVLEIRPSSLIGAVTDICWSPRKSTMFVLLTQDKRLEIWDMSSSVLDPIEYHKAKIETKENSTKGSMKTVVQFSNCGSMIVVGDDGGGIEIHRLNLMNYKEEQSPSLLNILQRHLEQK